MAQISTHPLKINMYKGLDFSKKSHLSIQFCVKSQGKARNRNLGDFSSEDPPPREGIEGIETTQQDALR